MKAEELMIGDWVNYHDDDKIVPKQVSEITNYKQLQLNDKNNWIIVGEKYCEPIPLTDEILEKNFPEYERGYTIGWWPNEVGYQIEWSGDADDNEIILQHVQYVHQLQHILRLVRYEKEIEL